MPYHVGMDIEGGFAAAVEDDLAVAIALAKGWSEDNPGSVVKLSLVEPDSAPIGVRYFRNGFQFTP